MNVYTDPSLLDVAGALEALPDLALARIIQCAVKRRRTSAGDKPARQLSLQPVAIGAVVEETKQPKPLV